MGDTKEENVKKKIKETVKEALRAAGYTDDIINQSSFFDVKSTTNGAFNRITNVFVLNEAERKRANDAIERLGSILSDDDINLIKKNVCYFTSGQLAELESIVNKPANEIKQAFISFATEFNDYLTELQREIAGIEEKINNLSNDNKAQFKETIATLKNERIKLTNAIAEHTDLLYSIQSQLNLVNEGIKNIEGKTEDISKTAQRSEERLITIEKRAENIEKTVADLSIKVAEQQSSVNTPNSPTTVNYYIYSGEDSPSQNNEEVGASRYSRCKYCQNANQTTDKHGNGEHNLSHLEDPTPKDKTYSMFNNVIYDNGTLIFANTSGNIWLIDDVSSTYEISNYYILKDRHKEHKEDIEMLIENKANAKASVKFMVKAISNNMGYSGRGRLVVKYDDKKINCCLDKETKMNTKIEFNTLN